MNSKGLIFDIKRFSVNDGPGIRTTIFFKGCLLSCWWCHNPEGLSSEIERLTVEEKLFENIHHVQRIVGRYETVYNLMDEIEKDTIFYENSGGGVTFSGGEPLLQIDFVNQLARECRIRGIHTCIDTSGFIAPETFKSIIDEFDLFLFDLKVINNDKHLLYTGLSNEMIFLNLNILSSANKNFIIRFPVIPGINDDSENIQSMKNLLKALNNRMMEIHILPYHDIALHKYQKFSMNYKLKEKKVPHNNHIESICKEFKSLGFKVKIGGL